MNKGFLRKWNEAKSAYRDFLGRIEGLKGEARRAEEPGLLMQFHAVLTVLQQLEEPLAKLETTLTAPEPKQP